MNDKPTSFSRHYHLAVAGTPSITCWIEEQEPTAAHAPKVRKVSFAICSPKDHFSRKKGTFIAQQRMEAGKYIEVLRFKGEHGPLIDEIIDSLYADEKYGEGLDKTHNRVYEVLDYYYHSKEPMDSVENKETESHGFYYGKVLPYLSKFRLFQRIFYGI